MSSWCSLETPKKPYRLLYWGGLYKLAFGVQGLWVLIIDSSLLKHVSQFREQLWCRNEYSCARVIQIEQQ